MNLQIIKGLWVEIASYFGKKVSEAQVKQYAEAWAEQFKRNENDLRMAFSKYRSNSENHFFPLPARLSAELEPQLSHKHKASVAVGRLFDAVNKFGYPDPQGARAYVGELGWSAVQRFGGWRYICENLGLNLNPGTFRAQAIAICEGHSGLGNENFDRPIGIEQRGGDLISIGALTNKMLTNKEK